VVTGSLVAFEGNQTAACLIFFKSISAETTSKFNIYRKNHIMQAKKIMHHD
jgi:hypothetical protein